MGFPFHHFFLFFSSSTFFIFKVEVVQVPGVRKKFSSGITKRGFFFFFFFFFFLGFTVGGVHMYVNYWLFLCVFGEVIYYIC